jgi:2,4-dienoyl-CoA reductase-like NADH-dependent reductase (Old Yellow Enzyme family)/thioredoxin reductase
MTDSNHPFPLLAAPLAVGKTVLKNRIVSAPMAFGMIALDPEAGPRAYRKIESIAKGGAAAVCVGETDINFTDANRLPFPTFDFTVHSGRAFDAIGHYAMLIKKHGAAAMIELAHPGAEKTPFEGQKAPIGPVSMTRPDGVRVAAMTGEDMRRVSREFADAAEFMKAAGFDGVLIHAGHGFIFTQFLSARTNLRSDRYGGPLENRARFPLEVLKEIRERVGPDFLIEVRLSAEEGIKGGITAEETGRFCVMMEGIVDLVHVSTGLYTEPIATRQFSSMFERHGCNADLAAEIKKYTSLPVGVVGGINSPEQAEQILSEGKADYVILGRQMLADPRFPEKAFSGKADEIRRCIRCFNCFPGSPEEGYTDIPWPSSELAKRVGSCTINPISNLPIDLAALPCPASLKTVLVVGGGPAGMQAAITAAERGHTVFLAEKATRLGGILNFTDTDTDKADLRNFKDLLRRLTERRGVKILLNRAADKALIDELKPDAVILAVGSHPAVPPIPGIGGIRQAIDVYGGYTPGNSVIIVGGGLVGCEVGLHLSKTGHTVTVIELLTRIASDAFGMYREALIREMEKEGIRSLTETRCLEVSATSVRIADKDGNERVVSADSVVYALGMKANSTEELEKIAGRAKVFKIGDCVRPAKVDSATREGFLAAIDIM